MSEATHAKRDRRQFLRTAAGAAGVLASRGAWAASAADGGKAQVVITLDLEMARNFPAWTDTHWDYEKGNLNDAAKKYTVEACRRVKAHGARLHTFVVGRVLEHESVDWLAEIAAEGHPIGNHTYDHVYLLASQPRELQFRFQRAPWLLGERTVPEILREQIALTNHAVKERLGVDINGFRTPGGFATGLDGREDLQTMLLELGFDWISCKYPSHDIQDLEGRDERPAQTTVASILAAQSAAQPIAYPTGLVDLPMSPISDIGAFRNGRWRLDDFLRVTELALEQSIEQGGMFDFLAHPSCLGVVDPEFKAIEMICRTVEKHSAKAELTTLDAVAKRFKSKQES